MVTKFGDLFFSEYLKAGKQLQPNSNALMQEFTLKTKRPICLTFKAIKKRIQYLMEKNGMQLQREMDVIPVKGKEANRFLSEWGPIKVKPQMATLTIRTDPKKYTTAYREFTREFYVAL